MSMNLPSEADIDSCLIRDRHQFRKRLRGIKRHQDSSAAMGQGLTKLLADMQASSRLLQQRKDNTPRVSFAEELPISAKRQEIAELIQRHQVIVLCGETGSGKSTQLPKICLDLGRGVAGRIAHTQPRRIAARSLAARVAAELETELGSTVGYKVRFKDRVSALTQIKLLTDGMLLAEIQQDKFLNEYDTLIIDEAHERSLNIDFLLGYLKQLLPKRPDLKLIITSATIDPERFAQHFNDAPVINVSGRTYAVELRYRPLQQEGSSELDEPLQQALVDAVDELSREPWGDILVFLSGEREIRESAETLKVFQQKGIQILPLFARQGAADQARIFKPSGNRRIVLATNVAETSLTVPGIRNVIDAGFARISRYSHRSKVQRLPVERISQASANQRKGRCGRVAAGICIRLYSEEDFDARSEFTQAEILRTNLAAVILQMKLLGFGDIERFPFVDPPDNRLIRDGYRLLHELGAVNAEYGLTQLGRKIARLPVDPRIGRMLMESTQLGCVKEVQIIAAALSVQDPRDRPMDKQQQADQAHALFKHEESDFLSLLQLWDYLQENREKLSQRKFRDFCRQHFVSWTRLNEWRDIHQQLLAEMQQMGYQLNHQDAGLIQVHQALLTGLLGHIGFRPSGRDKHYQGARGQQFYVFPGSGLFAQQPKWVMAAELVETTKLYARTLGRVDPAWVEHAAGHLLKRSYSEPHWQSRRGQVAAYEKVSLYGLVLVARRRVNYGPINAAESREIFIRDALVEGDFDSKADFWRQNQQLIEYVHSLEAKSRRRDILVDPEKLMAFYMQRIPQGIYSTPQFDKWLRQEIKQNPKCLHMRLEDLLQDEERQPSAEHFPDQLQVQGMALPLKYHFDPGHAVDGVRLLIPVSVINQISADQCDWLVPGLLTEKLTELLRSLPKQLRKHFVPVPEYAKQLAERLQVSDRPLLQALAEAIKEISDISVPEDAWDLDSVSDHLKMSYEIVDESGKSLGNGRQLHELKKRFAHQASQQFLKVTGKMGEIESMRDWDCGDIPESIDIKRAGIDLKGYPALVDEKDSVALRILDTSELASKAHRLGLVRLFLIKLGQTGRYLKKNLPNLQTASLQYAKAAGKGKLDLESELLTLILDLNFLQDADEIRTQQQFQQRFEERKALLMSKAQEVNDLVAVILKDYQQIRKQLTGFTQLNWMQSINDIQQQLDNLVFKGFIAALPYACLQQYPRYLKGIALRLDKLQHAAARDQKLMNEMSSIQQKFHSRWQQVHAQGRTDERLEEIRWILEELRISLFCQEIKTLYPISTKRLEKRWRELGL